MLILISTLQPWTGERIDEILYQPNLEQVWAADQLAAIGLVKPDPFTIPDGFHITGSPSYSYDEDTGKVSTIYTTEADVVPVPETLTRWQFFTVAAMQSIITQDEALAAVSTGTLPQPFVDFIATLPVDQQFGARMLLAGTNEFHRHHPFVTAFLSAKGMTDAQADQIWIQGSSIGST